MTEPTPSEIEDAFKHGKWLRSQVTKGSDRMLADLSYEVQRLRAQVVTLADKCAGFRIAIAKEERAKR